MNINMADECSASGSPPCLLDLPETSLRQLASILALGCGSELRTMCRPGRQLVNLAVTAAKVITVGSCTI